ncbi:hypothetical protein D9611_003070 [Ephemerocybe angulata]|uniref:Uncharacterized protein n=1 Tax=Ephemerocybe angulata TaxID=980116 RepID=A0A8H5FI99_9AGAR|nr:hypothetical protein D9611_003070 [Tulosesus angulatus]
MTGVTLEQDLELHDNSVFLFRLVNAVLPTVQPLTSILVTYRFCGSIPFLPSVQENLGYTDDRARGAAIANTFLMPKTFLRLSLIS